MTYHLLLQAIRAWTDNSEYGRVSLVKQYFQCIDGAVLPLAILQVADQKLQTCAQAHSRHSYEVLSGVHSRACFAAA